LIGFLSFALALVSAGAWSFYVRAIRAEENFNDINEILDRYRKKYGDSPIVVSLAIDFHETFLTGVTGVHCQTCGGINCPPRLAKEISGLLKKQRYELTVADLNRIGEIHEHLHHVLEKLDPRKEEQCLAGLEMS